MSESLFRFLLPPKIVASTAAETQFDNFDSVLTCFDDLSDPRSNVNQLLVFSDLLVICITAVIADADGPQAIGVWADNNQTWLQNHLKLFNGIPSHPTWDVCLRHIITVPDTYFPYDPKATHLKDSLWLTHYEDLYLVLALGG